MGRIRFGLMVLIAGVMLAATPVLAQDGGVYREGFRSGGRVLTVEVLDDDLVHFQLEAAVDEPVEVIEAGAIWTTPMVAKTDYPGPSVLALSPGRIETPELRVEIDAATLCVTLTDLTRTPELLLTTTCPAGEASSKLAISAAGTTDIYGLGEQFQRRGGADGNWFGKRRVTLNSYGNALERFEGGNTEGALFPVIYALGADTENYALFVDDVYQQYWEFTADPFSVETKNSLLRWYVMTGADLPDLRADYMELTGRAPVPPKQMFGLWVSEYGYENWAEMQGVIDSMRAANFPMDGMVLDLQWFGGIAEPSHMGNLAWDEANFPQPAENIARLRADYGLGIMTIEESYVDESTADYTDLAARDVLTRKCGLAACEPVRFDSWWGEGSMIDWTNPEAAAYWHESRRQPLIEDGVIGHWTDLGEPEIFDPSGYYYGLPELDLHGHADIHNLYNFLWSKSIFDGYLRDNPEQRPFILSRSGTSGSQRFGVAMWSGDIAANMPSLTTQFNAQMHMSLSGVDYFGSDIGGFYRQVFDPVLKEDGMYTLWLANSTLLDVPLRPHTSNTNNFYDTAPSLIGDVPSNLANVRLRYSLSPYLYSLAHGAYRDGSAIFAPLVYAFQTDPQVRTMGSQKMLGDSLMMATVTGYSTESIAVYLPAGGWFNTLTGEFTASAGEKIDAPIRVDDILRVPLFARDGAIIPQMPVDEGTLNMLGQRTDGGGASGLIVTVYVSEAESGQFTLIEDDGTSTAYQGGAVRETPISFGRGADGAGITVSVGAAVGTYAGAPESRTVEVRLVTPAGVEVQAAMVSAGDGATFTFGE